MIEKCSAAGLSKVAHCVTGILDKVAGCLFIFRLRLDGGDTLEMAAALRRKGLAGAKGAGAGRWRQALWRGRGETDELLSPRGVGNGLLKRPLIELNLFPQLFQLGARDVDFLDGNGVNALAVGGGALRTGGSARTLDPSNIAAVASGLG